MTDLYAYEKCSVLAVQDVPRANTRQYGIVSARAYRPDLELVSGIVEKPKPEDAPSTLAVVGRYVLSGAIFEHLENLGTGAADVTATNVDGPGYVTVFPCGTPRPYASNLNFARGVGCAMESLGHSLERMATCGALPAPG